MLYCGIDVAKYKHVALILDEQGKVLKPAFPFSNDRQGFDQLLGLLAEFSQPVTIGLEATGHYWLSLYDDLDSQGHPVIVLNPLKIAACRRSGICRVKNDRNDPSWIADYVRIANLSPTEQDLPSLLQLRELSRFRFGLTDQNGDCPV